MKPKKGIIILSIVVVIAIGAFVGVKISNSVQPANEATLSKIDNNQEENKEKDKVSYEYSIEDENNNLNVGEKEVNKDKKEEKTEDEKDTETIMDEVSTDYYEEIDDTIEETNSEESKDEAQLQIEVYNDLYVVKEGDTLYEIARNFYFKDEAGEKLNRTGFYLNDAVNLIAVANQMESMDKIYAGNEIYIPTIDAVQVFAQQNFEEEKVEEEK